MSMARAISLDEMPNYDLFLSQVIDFLNSWFPEEKYTHNIVQNYIKFGIISRPINGKKRGYTRMHIIQLILLSYLRPILSGDEIKRVFSLAFNEINEAEDDIITWEDAYEIFSLILKEDSLPSPEKERMYAESLLKDIKLKNDDKESILDFITILILVTRANILKKKALEFI